MLFLVIYFMSSLGSLDLTLSLVSCPAFLRTKAELTQLSRLGLSLYVLISHDFFLCLPFSAFEQNSCMSNEHTQDTKQAAIDWDCSLHLPLWISKTERALIEDRLDEWTQQLDASGADIATLAACLKKPLRPLWISQKTVIWLNEVPDHDSWDFTPIILVSASFSTGFSQIRTTSEYSWNYIAGAGDDEESWARGLIPNLFWNHAFDLISSGPDLCNQKVADIVEKDRVYRAQRGQNAPQIIVKPTKLADCSANLSHKESQFTLDITNVGDDLKSYDEDCAISWLGATNLAVCTSQAGRLHKNLLTIIDFFFSFIRLPLFLLFLFVI